MTLHISLEPDATDEDKTFIEQSVYDFNLRKVPNVPFLPINIFLRDATKRLVGGLVGGCWGGWFHVSFVWVAEAWRGQGYGTQLLQQAEKQARALGCQGAFLETHSFQAPELYQRLGYVVIAELPDYPEGYTFYVMKKLYR
jgi:ribosomal protein S18 acetylase RimI-like enzyme